MPSSLAVTTVLPSLAVKSCWLYSSLPRHCAVQHVVLVSVKNLRGLAFVRVQSKDLIKALTLTSVPERGSKMRVVPSKDQTYITGKSVWKRTPAHPAYGVRSVRLPPTSSVHTQTCSDDDMSNTRTVWSRLALATREGLWSACKGSNGPCKS